ncbi:MAG: hypothetical protein ACI8UP_004647 [Porticoccaceae bacterium]
MELGVKLPLNPPESVPVCLAVANNVQAHSTWMIFDKWIVSRES